MTTYAYVRASTIEQVTGKSTLDDQSRRITGAAMMRGETIFRVFSDPGVSGAMPISLRPAGGEMLALLQPGDTVIAAKMDRIFRSAEDALVTAGRLQERGIRLVIADMGPDPVTENGSAKLFFTMLAAFAEFERNRIAERVKDGRDACLEVDEAEQAVITQAKSLDALGLPLRKIAAMLDEMGLKTRTGAAWHHELVQRMVRRPQG